MGIDNVPFGNSIFQIKNFTDGRETPQRRYRHCLLQLRKKEQASIFAYSDADQITCGAAKYMCGDKYCYWADTLTTPVTGAVGGADW